MTDLRLVAWVLGVTVTGLWLFRVVWYLMRTRWKV